MERRSKRWPGLAVGVLAGLVLGWLGMAGVSQASGRIVENLIAFEAIRSRNLPWLLLIVGVATALGLLMSIRPIAAGMMLGAGMLWSVVGLAIQLQDRGVTHLLDTVFTLPGQLPHAGYVELDGSVVFVGVLLLVLGAGRAVNDARRVPARVQDQSQA